MLAGLGYFKKTDKISDTTPEFDLKENSELEAQFYDHAEQLKRISA